MKIPLFEKLENSKIVLLVGVGGGFDIFCGLPLYFWLRSAGKTVYLANLSFTEFRYCDGERMTSSLIRVLPKTNGSNHYFPELYLSLWLTDRFGETPVYAIERTGAKPVGEAYQKLVDTLNPDTLVLVDGGTDSLMRGDEVGLGTPQEDAASLYAAHVVTGVEQKFLLSIGFGVDAFHGVCHAHFLENVADLIGGNAYLGAWSLTRSMEEFRLYGEAHKFAAMKMHQQPSIVNTSIIASVLGWFGDRHATKRTEGSKLFINPLMSIYWAFQLEEVAKRNLYLDKIGETTSYQGLSLAIETFQRGLAKRRPWVEMPV